MVKMVVLGVVILLVVMVLVQSYVKAPPNKAYVITGIRKEPKILIGKAGLRIPFLVRVDKLFFEINLDNVFY